MEHQNWNTVVINGKQSAVPSTRQVSSGTTIKKQQGGKNSNKGQELTGLKRKLDGDEIEPLPTVSRSLSQQIVAARNAAGLTQKDLAQKINEKVDVIKSYEAGTALPNPGVLSKLQRALNTTLTK